MSVTVIEPRHRVHTERYFKTYWWCDQDEDDGGFSFDCDVEGNVSTAGLPEAALENYRKCVHACERFEMNWKIQTCVNSYWEPVTVKCECGREFIVGDGGEECECGLLIDEWGTHVNYLDRAGWEAMGGESYCGERWDEDY